MDNTDTLFGKMAKTVLERVNSLHIPYCKLYITIQGKRLDI